MKRTFIYTLISLAAMFAAPAFVSAQTDNKIQLSKKVIDNGNKTYTLTLETYATGSTESSENIIPTDFVLVMDHSGSMSNNNVTVDLTERVSTGTSLNNSYTYKVVVGSKEYFMKGYSAQIPVYTAQSSKGYTYNNVRGTTQYYYMDSDGKYWPVSSVDPDDALYYYLTVNVNGVENYITNNGGLTTDRQSTGNDGAARVGKITGGKDATIWTGVLYTRSMDDGYTYRYAETEAALTSATSGTEWKSSVNHPYSVTNNDEVYRVRKNQSVTRLDATFNAAEAFIRQVYRNNPKTGDKHQIAIIWYAQNNKPCQNFEDYALHPLSSAKVVDDLIAGLDRTTTNPQGGSNTYINLGLEQAYTTLSASKGNGHNKVVILFTDGEPGSNAGYFADDTARASLVQANKIKNETAFNNGANNPVKIYAIGLMSKGTADYHRTEAGGTNAGSNVNNANSNDKYRFMNYVSSNYKVSIPSNQTNTYNFISNISGAKCLDDITPHVNCNDHGGEAPHGYFQASDGGNLSEIFKSIANSESTVNPRLTDETAVVLDAITNMFKLPDGVKLEDIKLFTCDIDVTASGTGTVAKWKATGSNGVTRYKNAANELVASASADGYDHTEYWVPWEPWNTTGGGSMSDYIYIGTDGAPVQLTSPESDVVEITGYNYMEHYIGKQKINGVESWYPDGQKLIIQITIEPDNANGGGVKLETNTAQSGVYVPKDPSDPTKGYEVLEKYELPKVNLPYLKIIKEGLQVGESAIFHVVKVTGASSDTPDSDDPFTADVIITRDEEAVTLPYAVLKLLSAGYYKVTELPWAWAYTISHYTSDEDGIATTTLVSGDSYTLEMKSVDGPFTEENCYLEYKFKNVAKTAAADHAEANVNNNMGNTFQAGSGGDDEVE